MKHILKTIAISSISLLSIHSTSAKEEVTVNKGRELVMESINAHGGKEKWYGNGLLQFRWKYHMTDRGAIVDSVQTVDPSSLAVVHEVPGKDIKFGWNNGKTWISPKDATFTPPPQFWSLTPTYFIGIPFVFNDENAEFKLLEETKKFEGKDYTQVKITYNKEAGESPDDYYVLLIDPETKLTIGTYYIVTHPLVAKNGVGPEKFITLDNLTDINGVKLASGHRTMKMENGKIGDQMRFTEVSGVKFVPKGSVDLSIPDEDLVISK